MLFCAHLCQCVFVTTGCKPEKQEPRIKSTNARAKLIMGTVSRYSDPPISSSKSAPRMPTFSHFEVQIELSLQSCVLFVEARNCGNKGPTSATPEAALPGKKQGFAPESVLTREFARFRTVTLPNYLVMT
jgi:hypothetical protein